MTCTAGVFAVPYVIYYHLARLANGNLQGRQRRASRPRDFRLCARSHSVRIAPSESTYPQTASNVRMHGKAISGTSWGGIRIE
jgi:hypothetical protein